MTQVSKMQTSVRRGDIVVVNLDGAEGSEKQNDPKFGVRPCLIVQNDKGNEMSPLTIIAPLSESRQNKGLPVQVAVTAAELGLDDGKNLVVECGHLRSIDGDLRVWKRLGTLDPEAMKRVDAAIIISLGL
ncbi:MAG: type II toxin-antitoxin system PemK/MazF family toxin [Novosphingobium sp.]